MPAQQHTHLRTTLPSSACAIRFFALTTCGLESISARELARAPGVTVIETGYRRVEAISAGPLSPLLALRTVDDVFLHLATWTEIGRPRSALERLRALSARLDLVPALSGCATVRPIPCLPAFSLSVSFVGKRNYTTREIKAILAERIASRHGWTYQPDDRAADVNLRVFIEHEQAYVGMRLAKQPLHERSYRQAQRVGALKPSVAAALVMAADVHADQRVLDPCCGSGTLVIEAAMRGADACGGDSDPAAVQAAQINCRAAGISASLQCWQAEALPLATASIDRVICNLPWGRQTQVDGSLATFYQAAFAEMRRVLAPAGRIALLTTRPALIDPLDLACGKRCEISLFGQRPTLLVFS
jgi:tRNA (guanine6-N2)-methyltransferase